MKHKMSIKLALYFAAALLVFSMIVGSIFTTLFRNYTIELHQAELEERAVTMAGNLSEFVSGTNGGRMQGGYGAYLRFLDEIAMADVWIVNEDLELMAQNPMMPRNYSELPPDAADVVKTVFEGSTTFSEGFSGLLETSTLTVGTPIWSGERIVGALLLHAPVSGIDAGVGQGLKILAISVTIALLLSILLSVALVLQFTKPLKKINQAALRLAEGDYSARTQVQQEDEIGELAKVMDGLSQRLDQASQESERMQKMRQDFVANISHELRTPVTVIRGSLEALCDRVVNEPGQIEAYHQQMLKESLYLQRLVNDLLDLSRLQNADFKIEMQDISLCELVQDAVRSARQLDPSKSIEVQQDTERASCMIRGDYGRLRQMLLILLDNAVKFSPAGRPVTVLHNGAQVAIRNEGAGIPSEALPFIFDRFQKERSEENKSGTGLGLAIAKEIAERHQIHISALSQPGHMTEFRVRFSKETGHQDLSF